MFIVKCVRPGDVRLREPFASSRKPLYPESHEPTAVTPLLTNGLDRTHVH
jgi:hypothetical protein